MGVGDGPESPLGSVQDAAYVRRFLEMSIDLLMIADLETRVLELSESWERTLGWTRADLLGTPIIRLIHPDDIPGVEAELAGLIMGGEAVGVPVRIRGVDGSYRWLQGNARADLEAGYLYVTAADITDRKELEDALRRQIALEESVATITARLLAADDADVPDVIQASIGDLAEAMGADRGHFLRGSRQMDTAVIEWLHPEWGQRHDVPAPGPTVQEWWLDVLRSGELLRLEDVSELEDTAPEVLAALRLEGVRSVLLVPLPPHRGCWGFLGLVSLREQVRFNDDATSLLRLAGEAFLTALARGDDAVALLDARRELEHRNEELERSNEDLERFAYAAAHDLKAPLARIEMALAATERPQGDAGMLLDVARRGASRMRQLIEDLLAFASVGTGSSDPEEVALNVLLGQVQTDLAPLIDAVGADIRIGGLPTVWGHRSLLGQLFQNLLGNSLKFVKPDVVPVVEVTGGTDARGQFIRVADNGIGIDASRRAEVFGVFSRLNPDDQYPGSGIGLATCAKVVAYHGGQIWLEDGIDGGVAVVVRLPLR
ncbi:MAG: ATP-binding protein [Acidimicrobiales bacterium]